VLAQNDNVLFQQDRNVLFCEKLPSINLIVERGHEGVNNDEQEGTGSVQADA
jgi:hypothetical protein